MRAERLLSLVLLLRREGRATSTELARELGVSVRTVMRDIDALSLAGVPVYVDRGRFGGYSMLPGLRADLAGLTDDEAASLLAAVTRAAGLGLESSTSSAVRKLREALPDSTRAVAEARAARVLVEPDVDLLERSTVTPTVDGDVLDRVKESVFRGLRVRIRYAAPERPAAWRTVDPVGLVTARGIAYLLAQVEGADRTYRLSRIVAAEVLAEPADRPVDVDLAALWRDRAARFRRGPHVLTVVVRVDVEHRDALRETALSVEETDLDPSHSLVATFQDERHALWALWQAGPGAVVIEPASLRSALERRAQDIVDRYAGRTRPTMVSRSGSTPSG